MIIIILKKNIFIKFIFSMGYSSENFPISRVL